MKTFIKPVFYEGKIQLVVPRWFYAVLFRVSPPPPSPLVINFGKLLKWQIISFLFLVVTF